MNFQLVVIALILQRSFAAIFDFEKDFKAIPNDRSPDTLRLNRDKLSVALQTFSSGNTIIIPSNVTFYLMHGVFAREIHDVIFQVDGTLKFERQTDKTIRNPYNSLEHHNPGQPSACIHIENSFNILVTSTSSMGVIDGGGVDWWGIPYVGYARLKERRPVLFHASQVKNMTIENIVFKDAPLYTLQLVKMDGLIVRYSSIIARRTKKEGHSLIDLSAFNTDGIDVSGKNVHVHDVDIWNQDDCIAVKDESTNMLFERIYASGLGLVIGSIGGSTVQNITFRDSLIFKSYKGIYMKFREDEGHGIIRNILFENIIIEEPIQWGLWIGPAQQAISSNICKGNPCSLCWPQLPLAQCNPIKHGTYQNITLRNVIIHNPRGSPGVILADASNPIDTITFDNVTVTSGGTISSSLSEFNGRDVRGLFRGLDQPIDDHKSWFYSFYFYLFILLSTFILMAGLLIYGVAKCSKNYLAAPIKSQNDSCNDNEDIDHFMKRKLSDDNDVVLKMIKRGNRRPVLRCHRIIRRFMQALICIMNIILLYTIHKTLMALADRSNQSHFFVCRGVINGVALADTWPIPHCFTDKTTGGRAQIINFWLSRKTLILYLEMSCLALLFIFPRFQRLSSRNSYDKAKLLSRHDLGKGNRNRERTSTDATNQVSDSDTDA